MKNLVNELRIGNLIKPVGNFPYWKVTAKDFEYIQSHPNEYESIIITEENLLMFGFENGMEEMPLYFGDAVFYWNKLEKQLDVNGEKHFLNEVHRLQNLVFELTNKELCQQQ
jgi:hypothetical protein